MSPELPQNGEQPVAASKSSAALKKIPPYWYPYTTMAKGRWLGREILEIVSTEFRDRSTEYYRYALESGVTTINGKIAKPTTVVQNGDRIENVVHRHEPPVTSTPIRIIHHDEEREFIVIDKPGSIPVHASGRYFRNSLVEILKNEFGFKKVYTINRLDRLTSGLMIIPLSSSRANTLSKEFAAGTIRKEYVARCKGQFPEEEITCEMPLLTIDRQMGLNVVHPDGKHAKTVFKRLHYDSNTDTSVVRCRPLTGRSHQIRVHLQYLGYSIANDPIYSEIKIWGENLGKGGLDLTPSDERAAPLPPQQIGFEVSSNPELLDKAVSSVGASLDDVASKRTLVEQSLGDKVQELSTDDANSNFTTGAAGTSTRPKLLPRETGHDIGMGSPVPLSAEMVGIITRLRNMKDEDEDWSRWRDVVFRAKGILSPYGVKVPLPPQNRRKRGGPVELPSGSSKDDSDTPNPPGADDGASSGQLTTEEALAKLESFRSPPPAPVMVESSAGEQGGGGLYCPECYLPLHPDPRPERLYIFLHALRYTTSLGSFETAMPEWAAEGWTWEE